MRGSRGSRFAFEVLFLAALAVAVAFTDLQPLEIAGVMLAGWIIVALLEWAAGREEPHYGSGLPPRYYVPQVSLPPAQPLEQVAAGYPETRDEAPTWIASAALREEMLGEWPVAAHPFPESDEAGAEHEPVYEPDPWTHAEELPVAPLPVAPLPAAPLPVAPLGELAPPVAPEPAAPAVEPQVAPVAVAVEPPEHDPREPDPGPAVEPPAPVAAAVEPLELESPEPDPEPAIEPAPAPVAVAVEPPAPEPEPEPELEPEPEPLPGAEAPPELVLVRQEVRMARWSIDPLAEPEPRRRFRRRRPEPATVEVPARPAGARELPGRARRQD